MTTTSAPGSTTRAVRVRADDGTWLAAWVHEPHRPRPGTPTVVLAHGWVLTHECWTPVVDRLLAAGVRVVTADQRGHGRSAAGPRTPVGLPGLRTLLRPAPASVRTLGDDLAAVVRTTTGSSSTGVVLAGHSMGGMALLALAGRHPLDDVRGVLLLSTAAGQSAHRTPPAELLVAALATHVPLLRIGPFATDRLQRAIAFAPDADAALVHQARRWVSATSIATFGRYHAAMRRHDEVAALHRLSDVPTHVVVGALDRLTPVRQSEAIVRALPSARLDVLPGLGHMLQLEAPGLVAEHLLDLAGAR